MIVLNTLIDQLTYHLTLNFSFKYFLIYKSLKLNSNKVLRIQYQY